MAVNVVHVELGERSYSIHIGAGAWKLLEENLRGWNSTGKIMVVTNERVNSIYGHRIKELTLASRDWYSGMAEIVKIALTLDPGLFAYLEKIDDPGPEGASIYS